MYIYDSDSIHILSSVMALVFALMNYTGFKDNLYQYQLYNDPLPF